jgi:Trypsin-like peptidase domain
MISLSGAARIAGCLIATTQSLSAYAPCEDSPQMATEFGKNTIWGKNVNAANSPAELKLDNDTRWIRILLKSGTPGADWRIIIRDAMERPLQSISSEQLNNDRPFWTNRLPAKTLNVDLDAPDPGTTVRLMEYASMSQDAKRPYYSIKGITPDWTDLYSTAVDTLYRTRGDAVGMFIGHSGSNVNGFRVWSCSGFVVANKPHVLFVTNDHCGSPWSDADRWANGVCENAIVDFSWDGDPISREYLCKHVWRDVGNDLAVLELASSIAEAPPNFLVLSAKPFKSGSVTIIHHPASLAKRISQKCQTAVESEQAGNTVDVTRDFAHRCDTEGGSSGAPAFDENGMVVGVHHQGFQLTSDGHCDMFNKAIKIEKLVEFLGVIGAQGFQIK